MKIGETSVSFRDSVQPPAQLLVAVSGFSLLSSISLGKYSRIYGLQVAEATGWGRPMSWLGYKQSRLIPVTLLGLLSLIGFFQSCANSKPAELSVELASLPGPNPPPTPNPPPAPIPPPIIIPPPEQSALCAAGTYRAVLGGPCISVGDGFYSTGNSDQRIACPFGASTAGTNRSRRSHCKPQIFFNTTPGDCTTRMTEFWPGLPIYGCILGTVEDTTMPFPTTSGCSAANSSDCPAYYVGQSLQNVPNDDWHWDASKKAFISRSLWAFLPVPLTPYSVYHYFWTSDAQSAPYRFDLYP